MINKTGNLRIKALTTVIFLIGAISSFGQNKRLVNDKNYFILRDSIWLKNNHWSAVNLLQPRKIIDSLSAIETNFKIVPVYKFRTGLKHFDFTMKFSDMIEEDITRVSGFIIHNSSTLGYLSGFLHNKNWYVLPITIFSKDDQLVKSIDKLKSKSKSKLFEFYPFGIGEICYKTNDSTFIFDAKINRFIPINQYITKWIGLDNLNRYYLESDSNRNNIKR